MKLTKRFLFIISLIVGNIAIGIVVFYYYDRSSMFESIAVFTSLATAIYAIMNEPETKKEKPLLRIAPHLASAVGLGNLGLDILIDNIGDSVASGITGICEVTSMTAKPLPTKSLRLENDGAFSISQLTPNDKPYVYVAINSEPAAYVLQIEEIRIRVEYYSLDGEKQPFTSVIASMKDLKRELETNPYSRR
jgi:hypothetical protein